MLTFLLSIYFGFIGAMIAGSVWLALDGNWYALLGWAITTGMLVFGGSMMDEGETP
jgi:hypothetical protein